MIVRRLALSALLVASPFVSCASVASAPSTTTVLLNVTLIDGTGAAPIPGRTIVLRGARIESIGAVGEVDVPDGAEVLDLDGRFVVPGFIDLHVHLPGNRDVQEALLELCLEYGVTTILNPGAREGAGVELRERIRSGRVRGPRMFTAGRIIECFDDVDAPGEDGFRDWAVHVDSEAAVRAEVRAQVATGVDFIKLYRRMPPELVAAAVDEATRHGVPVIGHMGTTTWGQAVDRGVAMLVHSGWGTSMDELIELDDPESATDTEWYQAYGRATEGASFAALARALVEREVIVVPTLAITMASGLGEDAALIPRFRADLAPDSEIDDWWSDGWRARHPQYGPDSEEEAEMMRTVYFPAALAIARGFHRAGVTIGVGTDVGNSWIVAGFAFHLELELLQEAGIPPLDLLRMATWNGAVALGIEDEAGTIEAGKRADLVVLTSNPADDIRNTRAIESVFLAGERR